MKEISLHFEIIIFYQLFVLSFNKRKLGENHILNNIINIYSPNDKVDFISTIKNSKGDLFIFTNINASSNERLIYAFKANGEKFFENTDKYYKVMILDDNSINKYPLFTFLNINDIEYLISFSQDGPIELYDFTNNKINYVFNLNVVKTNSVIRKNIFTNLKFYNNANYILNAFIDKKKNYKLLVQKIYFEKVKISKENVILINNTNSDLGYRNSSVTCFEIKEFIECLYTNSDLFYTISIYDSLTFNHIYYKVIETNPITTDYLFSKCIYIKDNIGTFIYFINNNSSPKLSFKELIIPSSSLTDFQINDYISSIIINKNNNFMINNNYTYNEIIKGDENNIFYISTDKNYKKIFIILIKILNNDRNLLIYYYEIKITEIYNFKIFQDITCFIYNDYLGVGMTHYNYNLDSTHTYSSFFIIGNISINNINIPENIDIFDKEYYYKIEDINFNIDNNIFGYIPKGIKIITELNGWILGFNIYSQNQQKNIESNEIILINDIITFIKINSLGVKLGDYSLEIIPIISEPDLDEYISNFNLVEYYPDNSIDFNSFYQPKIFFGKISYFSFSVNKCYSSCEICNYQGDIFNNHCLTCSSDYPFYYNLSTDNLNYNCLQSCPDNYTIDENNQYLCIEKLKDTDTNKDTNTDTNKYTDTDTNKDTDTDTDKDKDNDIDKDINIVKIECSEAFPYEIIDNGNCRKDCSAKDFLNKICKINYHSIEAKEKIINNIINEIKNGSLNSLLINVTNDDKLDIVINDNKDIYQITSSFNQNNKYYNISTINLGECEDILKLQYKINNNETLILFKFEYYVEGCYIPIIEYQIFHPNTKEQLDLNYCKDKRINISIPVLINENMLMQYNSSSDYYNNICYKFETINGTDITIYDRKNDYNKKNLSLCEGNCKYNNYNLTSKRVICECNIKTIFKKVSEINIDFDKILDRFIDFKKHSNIGIIKCYKVLFTKEGLFNNIGMYILLILILLNIICSIIFCIKGYNWLYKIFITIINTKKKENDKKNDKKNGKENDKKYDKKYDKKNDKKMIRKMIRKMIKRMIRKVIIINLKVMIN